MGGVDDSQQRRRQHAWLRNVLLCATAAITVALAVEALWVGYSPSEPVKALQVLAVLGLGTLIIGGAVSLALVHLAGWKSPVADDEFDRLVARSEALAGISRAPAVGEVYERVDPRAYDWEQDLELPGRDELADEFTSALRDAVGALPLELHAVLEHVAVVVSDGGAQAAGGPGGRGAYGLYVGDTIARDFFHDRVLIFRDTLMRDFGDDSLRLRAEISRTLRHELAHHLGYDERGVRDLGL